MVILRELDENEGRISASSPGYFEWARQVRAHYTRANGVLNSRGFYSELWGFDVGSSSDSDSDSDSSSGSDSDCVIISPSSFTGKRKNPCRDLVVAGYTPVTMEVPSKYTSAEMVMSFRKAVRLTESKHEESIITEPVREDDSQPNHRLMSLYASNFKGFKDSFFRVRSSDQLPDLMHDEIGDPLFPFYWTDNPRLIKGTIFETLSDFEQDIVHFLDSFALMDTADILRCEGNSEALTEYLQRMRTISNEERLAFLAKARQQKANPAAGVTDPLKQLQVEEAGVKEGRSKKRHDGRIPVEIPGKAAAKVTGSEGVVPPLKKQKTEKTSQPVGDADKGKGKASSSTQPSSEDTEAAASLSWASFDPLEFIERGVTMVGDMTRFTNTPTEDLRRKALEYEVKGTLLNYLLTNRQEQEVQEAKRKVKVVDDHLADIEKKYSETKTKLEEDIRKLKESQEGEAERLKKEYEDKLAKVKEGYAASETKLKENAAAQDEMISKLSKEKDAAVFSVGTLGEEKERLETDVKELQLYAANQYEEGFAYALEQVKLLFSDLDAKRLAEIDAMNQIIDGKLVPYVPPSE
ncbi:unnamed protein product [Trifolium pratense]|uniref:Uncharacterized protein n=1 Tax=Trifolium pratense TaxID=57577 RepID=A0ACB0K812_TRIPR|nr:unnamed protein product [Trifolium pratense]